MSCELINLTARLVAREIDDILSECPPDSYQAISSTPYFRQKLMAYVLSHVRNRHVVIEGQNPPPIDLETFEYLLDEKRRVGILIRKGFMEILKEQMPNNTSHVHQLNIYVPNSWYE